MSSRGALLYMATMIFWGLFVSFAFVSLYTAIELQSAARNLSKEDNRLAPLRTRELADKIDEAEKRNERYSQLSFEARNSLREMYKARTLVRADVVEALLKRGDAQATQQCTAPIETLKKCQVEFDQAACAVDWMKIAGCCDRVVVMAGNGMESREEIGAIRRHIEHARDRAYIYNQNVARRDEAKKMEADPYMPIAESVRAIDIPGFRLIFVLPQGVVVACFTSVMAALGAAVAALIELLKPTNNAADDKSAAFRGILYAPLVGGLTGFLVYFVVSAGTAFLVQPAPADPAQASNSLSAPALASLGILAGLAAENAIGWLQRKAGAFFKD